MKRKIGITKLRPLHIHNTEVFPRALSFARALQNKALGITKPFLLWRSPLENKRIIIFTATFARRGGRQRGSQWSLFLDTKGRVVVGKGRKVRRRRMGEVGRRRREKNSWRKHQRANGHNRSVVWKKSFCFFQQARRQTTQGEKSTKSH